MVFQETYDFQEEKKVFQETHYFQEEKKYFRNLILFRKNMISGKIMINIQGENQLNQARYTLGTK